MKETRIVMCPQLLERLYEALRACPGSPGMTVAEANAHPPAASRAGVHSIKESLTELVPCVRIEIVASDALVSVLSESAVKVPEHSQTGESALWTIDVIQATSLHRAG